MQKSEAAKNFFFSYYLKTSLFRGIAAPVLPVDEAVVMVGHKLCV